MNILLGLAIFVISVILFPPNHTPNPIEADDYKG